MNGRIFKAISLTTVLTAGALYSSGLLAGDAPSRKDHRADPGKEDARGREARNPLEIPPLGWSDILWRTVKEVQADRVLAVGAGVAFFGLLALFPTITALVSIYGLFADAGTMAQHLNLLGDFLPGGATDIVAEQMHRISGQPTDHLSFAFVFGLLLALWSANAGTKAIFDGLNVTYGETERRSLVRLNLLTLGFTIAGLAFVLVALAVIVGLPIALDFVGLSNSTDLLLRIGRWPLLFMALVIVLAVVYRYGPSRNRATWRWITPGSVLAATAWIIVSVGFSWYVSKFGTYNRTYGSLGAVIGFMTWMWISAVIVLIGAEFNAEIEHQTARDTTLPPAKPMGARGAVVADTVAAAS